MTPEPPPLNKQDLREALETAIQLLVARLDAITVRQDRLDAAIQSLTNLHRNLMENLHRIENRTERTEININALLMEFAGMNKSVSVLERADGQTAYTQNAQQRAINDLYAQIAEIKGRISLQ
jgi:chromosome segregation ATPase